MNAAFNVYRLPTSDPTTNNVGYIEGVGEVGLSRPFWDSHVDLSLSLNYQYDDPFLYYVGPAPKECDTNSNSLRCPQNFAYGPLSIGYVRSMATLDLRRSPGKEIDPVNPRSGFFLSTETQLAAIYGYGPTPDQKKDQGLLHFLGTDLRIHPEMRGYIPLPKRIVLALRFGVGALVLFNKTNEASQYGSQIRTGEPPGPTKRRTISTSPTPAAASSSSSSVGSPAAARTRTAATPSTAWARTKRPA